MTGFAQGALLTGSSNMPSNILKEIQIMLDGAGLKVRSETEKECNNGHNGDNKNVLKATGKGLKNETLKDLIGKMKKRRKELEEFQLSVKNFVPEQKKKAS
jgi:hypothetical protein